jgi:hypothetical protein
MSPSTSAEVVLILRRCASTGLARYIFYHLIHKGILLVLLLLLGIKYMLYKRIDEAELSLLHFIAAIAKYA